jgi:Leucine-rich repeat (LRR) protein
LKQLKLNGNGIVNLPVSLLRMRSLEVLELNKNRLVQFFDNCYDPNAVVLESLTFLSLNGNQLSQIPLFCKRMPRLR